ncbi:MAG: arginase [Desulfopila sp.]|jgi:arginase|nr:arginase [Desulfopila sp.]
MKQTVSIIGIPMDLGQTHRGVDMAPVAIRYAGLAGKLRNLGYNTTDQGNINVPGHYTLSDTSYDERLTPIREACEEAYRLGAMAMERGEIPLFLGGDHSAAIGTIGGVTHQKPCGLIWVDAHGDFNTPDTSASENIHGMALAVLLGQGSQQLVDVGRPGAKVAPENVVMIGVRDLDPEEKKLLAQSGCTVYTMRDVDELGMHEILRRTLAKFASLATIHLSLDMDAIDPQEAPGVGTPSHGGLTYREAQLIMETLCDSGKLQSVDVMEVNPILDIKNKTAQVAVSLLASLFGKSII